MSDVLFLENNNKFPPSLSKEEKQEIVKAILESLSKKKINSNIIRMV